MDRKLLFNAIHVIMYMVLFLSANTSFAQILKQPVLGFSSPCASDSFNSFTVDFEWEIPLVNNDNKFILELSDANGSFNNATTLSTVSDKNTYLNFTFTFSFPKEIYGEHYAIRVRSTSPAKTSPASKSFPAYYRAVNKPLLLNNGNDVTLCDGPQLLEVNNYPDEPYYTWYKDFNLIPGEKNAYLEVTEPGLYFVEVDYGQYCSSDTSSNLISVSQNDQFNVVLEGEPNVELCINSSYTLTATTDIEPDDSFVYKWYKNGALMTSTASNMYTITDNNGNSKGEYYVEIDSGSGCPVLSDAVVLNISDFEVTTNVTGDVLLLPSQSKTIQARTTANSPSFIWYKDGTAISGATSSSLTIVTPGAYKVEVTQGEGCSLTKRADVIKVSYPSDFEIEIDEGDYTACASTSATLSLSKINALTNNGVVISVDESIIGEFSFQWYKDGKAISGETQRQINIPGLAYNGTYMLKGTITSFNTESDSYPVKLGVDAPVISSDKLKICDGTDQITISSSVTDSKYNYKWYKNGMALTGSGPTITATTAGTYTLGIAYDGCEVKSNTVEITPYTDDEITLNKEGIIYILKGQTEEIVANGADSYTWYDGSQQVLSTSSGLVVSLPGIYTLIATIGTCEFVKTVEVKIQESTIIPNVISPNGDGINDTWAIPVEYLNKPNITITIYGSNGELIFTTDRYLNDWPKSSSRFSERNPVYYYTIAKGREVIKKGTITLIK